jgi:dihydropteroate synthase
MDIPPPAAPPPDWKARFPDRATIWQLAKRRLELRRRPLVMGILNVTPDSFSDGGQFDNHGAAVEQALRLAGEGADILDVGGESTRPYADPVDVDTELRRVIPVIESLASRLSIPISIDTAKAAVARAALAAGAEIINDVSALEGDPQMLGVARSSRCGVCVMHMQGTPRTMQDAPTYRDVVAEVLDYLRARRDRLTAAGIDAARVALDPGIGFGKTHQHNLSLMAACWRFHELGCAVLVGPSRKGFIGKVIGDKNADRTAGTVGAALSLAHQGVQIVRVHHVAAVRQALMVFEATGGIDGSALILDES